MADSRAARRDPSREEGDELDNLDLERLQEYVRSRGHRLVKERVAHLRESKLRDLVRPQTEIETATLRGILMGIDSVMSIPEILIKEAKTHGK